MKKTRKQSVAFNIPTLTLEGGLFLPDQLEKAIRGDAEFQTEADYQTPKGLRIKDDYSRAFQIACAQWQQFSEQFERTDINADQLTKDFVFELLKDVFAYAQLSHISGIHASDRHYPAQLCSGHVPIIVAPFNLGLDESHDGFAVANTQWQDKSRKKSAFQMAQELLNASDQHLWALVTNGKQIRLLRDAASLTRPSFLEIDLQDILQGKRFSEFANAWRLIHASRFNQAANPEQSIWEKWRESGKQEGSRVRDGLRNGVENALLVLGQGFIQYPANQLLRDALLSGELSKNDFFQELLRLVYRFIFLFNVEERGILHPEDNSKSAIQARQAYALGYALARLRNTCLKRRARNQFTDQWQAIKVVFKGLEDGQPLLALPALGGLFASHQCKFLGQSSLDNAFLLTAMESLRWANLAGTKTLIDYRNMDTEELGSVYESLLELVPEIDIHARKFGFVGITSEGSTAGNARKISGSYYTPDSLVQELIKSALEPVIEERIKQNLDNPTDALLAIRVIDPACGSGHFLLAAARKLAERLAQLRAPEGAVKPKDYRQALHDVIRNCIFGVDRNPMALELARTALWIEGFAEDEPLSFLDHHLQCGDALLGLMDLKALELGIPKDAFKPLSGDDNQVCKELAKKNTAELKDLEKKRTAKAFKQVDEFINKDNGLDALKAIEAMSERTTKQIAAKEQAYQDFLTSAKESPLRHAADMLLGAFLIDKNINNNAAVPTTASVILELLGENSTAQQQKRALATQACQKGFVLHWPLAFPQVFAQGGFDCVLGNPPWERIKLQEEEFFASRNPNVAQAKNKAERSQRIQWLSEGKLAEHLLPSLQHADVERQAEQALFEEFVTAKRTAEAASVFFHVKGDEGGRYPLTGIGDVNTYALFSESILQMTSTNGRSGFITPTGIATDDSTKQFFSYLNLNGKLVSLYSFENEEFIFEAVHHSFRFCLITLGLSESAFFGFFLRKPKDIYDNRRLFKLTAEEFKLINPNTLTCPIFRSNQDALLTKKIYSTIPVFVNEEGINGNPWDVSFMSMIHMSGDSHLFNDDPNENLVPLYEAKMFHQFDHRWGSYSKLSEAGVKETEDVDLREKADVNYAITPRYWINKNEVEEKLKSKTNKNWLIGWRDVTSAHVLRTVIATVIPKYAAGGIYLFFTSASTQLAACLLADMNALVHDFVARQKIGGVHLSLNYKKQIVTLPPSSYRAHDIRFINKRVIELTYTAEDIRAWALDLGYEGNPFKYDFDRRALLRAELDAYYAKLYNLTRDELRFILDPADVMGDDYPSETFRVLKNNEIKEFGEYRTRRLVLEAWDKLERGELV
jgi:type I restriction-modification system DNA methylase subunit